MTLMVILSGPSPTCREQIKGRCEGRQEDGLEGGHFALGWDSSKRWGVVGFGSYYQCSAELIW